MIKIPKFWQGIRKTPDWEIIIKINGGKLGSITGDESLGVCFDYQGMEVLRYAIAVEKL